jgi:lipoate-protein ligase A
MEGRLILDPPATGSWNMAVDEWLLEQAGHGAPPCLRFYGWSEPTLSLGYFQPLADRGRHEESRSVAAVRRRTGGGAILHHHELTYSWTCPATDRSAENSRQNYLAFHETALQLLRARGFEARLATSSAVTRGNDAPFLCFQRRAEGDLVVGSHKILGSAQRRRQGALLQHGSLLLRASRWAPQLPGLEDLGDSAFDLRDWVRSWCELLVERLGVKLSLNPLSGEENWGVHLCEAERFKTERWTARR